MNSATYQSTMLVCLEIAFMNVHGDFVTILLRTIAATQLLVISSRYLATNCSQSRPIPRQDPPQQLHKPLSRFLASLPPFHRHTSSKAPPTLKPFDETLLCIRHKFFNRCIEQSPMHGVSHLPHPHPTSPHPPIPPHSPRATTSSVYIVQPTNVRLVCQRRQNSNPHIYHFKTH